MDRDYELANNIDCSNSVNWDGGHGFEPIGQLDFINADIQSFHGIFAGNNYTVSNLYCNRTDQQLRPCALFEYINDDALIQDVKLDNFTVGGQLAAASLVALAERSTITNVQVTNLVIAQNTNPSETATIGGLIGAIAPLGGSSETQMIVTKDSVTGNFSITGAPQYLGGLIGYINDGDTSSIVKNNYANTNISTDSATVSGGFVGGVVQSPSSIISNNYAAGSLNITSTDPNLNTPTQDGIPDIYALTGSFIGITYPTGDLTSSPYTNNFAHVALQSVNPESVIGGFAAVIPFGADLYATNYFDADQAGTALCSQPNPTPANCNAISGQPDYFKNNSTNAPLDTWDFSSIWKTTSEFPVFGKNVVNALTAISPIRLAGKGSSGPTVAPKESESKNKNIKSSLKIAGALGGSSDNDDPKGLLGAVKRFIKNLPLGVVVGFPYAMFTLLFFTALIAFFLLLKEMKKVHILEALLKKQRLLAEERDAFWHLAANYLRAPVTLIVGGSEALHEAEPSELSTKLFSTATALQTKVARIMDKIEGSISLKSISKTPHGLTREKVNRVLYAIPVTIIALVVIVANYAAQNYRNLNLGIGSYLTQIILFVLAAIAFYYALSYLTGERSQRKKAEQIYHKQEAELMGARHELIEDTATTLKGDVSRLKKQLQSLPKDIQDHSKAAELVEEGTERLDTIIKDFSLLIELQEGTLKPVKKSVDLYSVLGSVRAKLRTQLQNKNIRIVSPTNTLPVIADSELAQQVIESIVANAIDYSPEGSTVKIDSRRKGDKIQLRVTDQGQGIEEKELDHLFKPFVRADNSSAMDMSHGGFGISLYLDKLIMEKLGGTISAQSTPNKGTSLTITWPVANTATTAH